MARGWHMPRVEVSVGSPLSANTFPRMDSISGSLLRRPLTVIVAVLAIALGAMLA